MKTMTLGVLKRTLFVFIIVFITYSSLFKLRIKTRITPLERYAKINIHFRLVMYTRFKKF